MADLGKPLELQRVKSYGSILDPPELVGDAKSSNGRFQLFEQGNNHSLIMKSIELDAWALRVLERIENHTPIEDSRIEIKSLWLDPVKAARRIAGHANAARGEDILWLIGADETLGNVIGADYQEFANWWSQTKACFETEVPAVQDLNVTYKTKAGETRTVAALCFDTSRSPYLVKNPKGGDIQFEVPWREGTAIRTATRRDLVLMLGALVRTPRIEVLEGRVCYIISGQSDDNYYSCTLDIYVVPLGDDCLTFPFHKAKAVLTGGGKVISESLAVKMGSWKGLADEHNKLLRGFPERHKEHALPTDNIQGTEDEVVFKGAGRVAVFADALGKLCDVPEMHLSITLVEAITEMKIVLGAVFKQVDLCDWSLVPNQSTAGCLSAAATCPT